MTTLLSSFIFIGNVLDVRCTLPYELVEGHSLDRATLEEARFIREYLDNRPVLPWARPWERYEVDTQESEFKQDVSTQFINHPLLPSEYRYYVIRYSGSNIHSERLFQASSIADLELTFPFEYVRIGSGAGIASHPILYQLQYISSVPPSKDVVSEKQLLQITSIFSAIATHQAEYPDVVRAIEMFSSLKFLQPNSEFQVLGMFAVIESLITHDPSPSETGDSLTRQVRTKLPLLSRRFESSIDYKSFFGDIGEQTVWKKLYDYRSALAHGKQPDFVRKLSGLRDAANAIRFLRSATKALLRHSLKEPRLVTDLRDC